MEYKNRLLVLLLISLVAKSAISDDSGHSNITTAINNNDMTTATLPTTSAAASSTDAQETTTIPTTKVETTSQASDSTSAITTPPTTAPNSEETTTVPEATSQDSVNSTSLSTVSNGSSGTTISPTTPTTTTIQTTPTTSTTTQIPTETSSISAETTQSATALPPATSLQSTTTTEVSTAQASTTTGPTAQPATTANSTEGSSLSPSNTTTATTDVGNSTLTTQEAVTSTTLIPTTTEAPHQCESRNPCKNGGTCIKDGEDYTCDCNNYWNGTNCDTDIDECSLQTDTCADSITTCFNIEGGYQCNCTDGFRWSGSDKKTCSDLDECRTGIHNCSSEGELCRNTVGSFECLCKDGFYKNPSDKKCEKKSRARYSFKLSDEIFTEDYNNKDSVKYNNAVEEVLNQTKTAFDAKQITAEIVVIGFRNGSIIAEFAALQNSIDADQSADALSGLTDIVLEPMTAEDLCRFSTCDSSTTECVGYPDVQATMCQCKADHEAIPGVVDRCVKSDVDIDVDVDVDVCTLKTRPCRNSGTCKSIQGSTTDYICLCTDKYAGKNCENQVVQNADYQFLLKLFIGVGVGLGCLAVFALLGLLVTCCAGHCAKDSDYRPSKYKKSHHYGVDDVTIDSWMPSLPRPKIKPGVFSPPDEIIEMSENGHHDPHRMGQRKVISGGTENPAFIPEADYDNNGKNGRLVANGKNGNDYVYF